VLAMDAINFDRLPILCQKVPQKAQMKTPSHSVFSYLYASPCARSPASLDLGFGRSCAVWTNSDDHVHYNQLNGHTFSFYLRGGEGIWRIDETPVEGWQGAMCIFPHGQSSEWHITRSLEMVHLYLPDTEMRRMFSEWTERDSRSFSLVDVTYQPAGGLESSFLALYEAMQQADGLKADLAMMQMVYHIISDDPVSAVRLDRVKGGLSTRTRKRVVDYIECHLDEVIRLKDLADIAELSEFHFQRSFKESCGVTPQGFIAARRVQRARARILAGDALSQVALDCGFSSQSHFTRQFKVGVGMTPAAFRRAVAK